MRIALAALAACTGTTSSVLTSTPTSTATGTLHPEAIGIAVGGAMACALNRDGSMACWGDPLGNESVALDGSFTQISMATSYVCGLRSDSSVACSRQDALAPAGGFSQISGGENAMCGLRFDGTTTCWYHDYYQKVPPTSETFTEISNGSAFGCGLHSDGTAMCWGGVEPAPPVPQGAFVEVDANGLCAITAAGQLECWALDGSYPLPPQATYKAVDGECGIEEDGTLACWGYLVSRHPELANPLPGHYLALGLAQFFDNVHPFDFHLCALRDDGAVKCINSDVPGTVP